MNSMTNHVLALIIAAASVLVGAAQAGHAQVVPIAKEAAEELVEWMMRQGGKHADEVAEMGGRSGAREVVEQLSRTVGRETAEQVVRRGGPGALAAVRGLDDLAADGARLIASHGPTGTLVVQQGGRASVMLFKQHGDTAVRILTDQGAESGARILGFAGDSLAKYGKALSPEAQSHLRQFVPAMEKADPALRAVFLEKLAAGGDDFLMWVSRRWKPIAVAGGLTVGLVSVYKLGDGLSEGVRGVVDALPDPGRDPAAWFAWWLPVLALVAIVVAGWVIKARVTARRN